MEKIKKRKMLRIFIEMRELLQVLAFAVCLTVGGYLGYTLGKKPVNYLVHGIILDDLYDDYTDWTCLSDDVTYYENGQHGYITGADGKKVLRDVKQVMEPENGYLAWFKSKGLRGYLDVRTGKAVIPAKYKKAWLFSEEGLACVMKEDSTLEFIDTLGQVAIASHMMSNIKYEEAHKDYYMFHDGHCPIMHGGKVNLIDIDGGFNFPDFYDSIVYEEGYWIARDSSLCKLFESQSLKEIILPKGCIDVDIENDKFIVSCSDGTKIVVDTEGKTLYHAVYDYVDHLTYQEGDETTLSAECYEYVINGKYGLLGGNLRKITGPVYECITALDKTHFQCQVADDVYVILNNKGELVE